MCKLFDHWFSKKTTFLKINLDSVSVPGREFLLYHTRFGRFNIPPHNFTLGIADRCRRQRQNNKYFVDLFCRVSKASENRHLSRLQPSRSPHLARLRAFFIVSGAHLGKHHTRELICSEHHTRGNSTKYRIHPFSLSLKGIQSAQLGSNLFNPIFNRFWLMISHPLKGDICPLPHTGYFTSARNRKICFFLYLSAFNYPPFMVNR